MTVGNLLEANEIFYTPFEPKQLNRMIMYMAGIPSFIISASGRPSFSIEPITIDHINAKRKVAGKLTWNDINITLYDPIVPSGAEMVMEWVRLHYESSTGRAGYSDYYQKDIILNLLGPLGDKVEEWLIKNAFIVSSNFGDLGWSNSGLVNIQLTLAYEYAELIY